jgi:hypothetical protein
MRNLLLGKEGVTWNGCKSFVCFLYFESISEKKRQLGGTPNFLALSKLGNINMLKNYEICIIGISFHKSSLALTKAWHRQRRQSVQ